MFGADSTVFMLDVFVLLPPLVIIRAGSELVRRVHVDGTRAKPDRGSKTSHLVTQKEIQDQISTRWITSPGGQI